jgi:hypothetical protein
MKSVEYVNEAFYVNQEMKDTLVLLREKDMTEEGWKNVEKLCAANREKFRCSYTDNKMDKAYAKIRKLFNSNGESVLALTRDTLK